MISLVLGIISMIILSNLLVQIVNRHKNQIGVLRSVGASKISLTAIYAFQMAIISILYFGLSVIWLFISIPLLNNSVLSGTGFRVILFSYQNYALISMLILTVIVSFVSLIIPFIKVWKLKPIDILKDK